MYENMSIAFDYAHTSVVNAQVEDRMSAHVCRQGGLTDSKAGGPAKRRTGGAADRWTGGAAERRTGEPAKRRSGGAAERRSGGEAADRRTGGSRNVECERRSRAMSAGVDV